MQFAALTYLHTHIQANKSDEEQPLIADTLQAFDLSTAADVEMLLPDTIGSNGLCFDHNILASHQNLLRKQQHKPLCVTGNAEVGTCMRNRRKCLIFE